MTVVAVCGATGKQGGGLVNALLKRGAGEFTIRGLTRNPDSASAKELAARGVEVVKADFDDIDSLKAAFQGADAVYAVTDFWAACGLSAEKELQHGKNLVDAAKATGIKHFVWSTLEDTRKYLPSLKLVSGPYAVPHFDAKGEIDDYMKAQLGQAGTSLYTSMYFDNLLPGGGMDPKPTPAGDGTFGVFIPTGGKEMGWVAVDDIGGVAAGVIAAGPEKYGGKNVPAIGEYITAAKVCEILSNVTGKTINAGDAPPEAWAQAVIGFGVPEVVALDLANMFAYYVEGAEDFKALRPLEESKALFPEIKGFAEFAELHKDEFIKALSS